MELNIILIPFKKDTVFTPPISIRITRTFDDVVEIIVDNDIIKSFNGSQIIDFVTNCCLNKTNN